MKILKKRKIFKEIEQDLFRKKMKKTRVSNIFIMRRKESLNLQLTSRKNHLQKCQVVTPGFANSGETILKIPKQYVGITQKRNIFLAILVKSNVKSSSTVETFVKVLTVPVNLICPVFTTMVR